MSASAQPAGRIFEAKVLEEKDFSRWDQFVACQPHASIYHLSVWYHILSEAFGKHWYVVTICQDGVIRAGMPLVHMRSRLFGNCLVSMPYFNYGGLLTEETSLAEPTLQRAVALGRGLGARHLELRHLQNYYPQLLAHKEKVSMWLSLPNTAQELLKSFKSKLRSQVQKGEKNNLRVKIGRTELLEDFYTVFSRNMRSLGTPVYGRSIFRLILEAFPDSARLVVVVNGNNCPVAGGFLLGYRDRLEIPWASSLREYNHLQSNMWLYWHCLRYACERGYKTFDFGRSTEGGSTFKFKEQWGAQPIRHYWHYHLEGDRELSYIDPRRAKFRLASKLGRRLPVGVTRLLGPPIVKHLP
jgi:FemAB-related protein (PEP-CTERM system-associated)